jgi:hypothetical protein
VIYVLMKPEHIGEVMNGERHELPVMSPARPGARVAIKTRRNRRPTCIVEVTACEPDDEGYVLTVRTIPLDHEPRLLAADSSRGYVRDPRLALQHEPEAVPEDYERDHLLVRAMHRDAKRKREKSIAAKRDRALLTVVERIHRAAEAARENHVGIGTDLLLLRRTMAEQRAGRRSEQAVLRRLEDVERRAYRDAA